MYPEKVHAPAAAGRRSDWVTLALAFTIGVGIMSLRAGFSVLYPAIATDMQLSVAEATGAYALSMPVYAVAVIVSGVLLDRIGIRATMLITLTVQTAGVVLAAA